MILNMQRWKIILIVLACLWGLAYASPNFVGAKAQDWMAANLPSWLPNEKMSLGLDLQGGSHLLMQVDMDVVVSDKYAGMADELRTLWRKDKVGYTEVTNNGTAGITVALRDATQADQAKTSIRDLSRDLTVTPQPDGKWLLALDDTAIRDAKHHAMEQSIEIIRRRIDETGTREPSIQQEGDDRILVQLPGVSDPERMKNLIGQTAKLTFRFVDSSVSDADIRAGRLPPGTESLPSSERPGTVLVVSKRVMVAGDTLTDAQATFNQGMPVVSFRFDNIGSKRFADATRDNVGKLFAIVLDNKVISAPVIREPIMGGSGIISGSFSVQEAQDLALLLRAGALPAPLTILEERTVGPGLGADSIHAGTMAAIAGLIAVIIFMLICYGLFGFFAVITLLFNLALIIALLSTLGATLTLPGIAGIVLTMGMAVDANVLIFERMREEMRLGRTPIAAIDAGFTRAFSAIVDSNTTTLIAALLLFMFGSGTIKGFAVTLSIGIITSVFAAMMITRLMIVLWAQRTKPKILPI